MEVNKCPIKEFCIGSRCMFGFEFLFEAAPAPAPVPVPGFVQLQSLERAVQATR